MRSISYVILGKNHYNMDDCIDYFLRKQKEDNKPEVFLELEKELRATEQYILNSLNGNYIWQFLMVLMRDISKFMGVRLSMKLLKGKKRVLIMQI